MQSSLTVRAQVPGGCLQQGEAIKYKVEHRSERRIGRCAGLISLGDQVDTVQEHFSTVHLVGQPSAPFTASSPPAC
jgi:hypothetical protein